MDETSLIIGALSAGLVEASKATASKAVKDGYNFLKNTIKKRLEKMSGKGDEIESGKTLENFEKDPQSYEKPLIKKLTEAAVEKDQKILQAAEDLMVLIKKSREKVQINQSINVAGQVDSIQNIGNVQKDVHIGIKHSKD